MPQKVDVRVTQKSLNIALRMLKIFQSSIVFGWPIRWLLIFTCAMINDFQLLYCSWSEFQTSQDAPAFLLSNTTLQKAPETTPHVNLGSNCNWHSHVFVLWAPYREYAQCILYYSTNSILTCNSCHTPFHIHLSGHMNQLLVT